MTITFNYVTCRKCKGKATFNVNLRTYRCTACKGAGNEIVVVRHDRPFFNEVYRLSHT